MGDFRRYFVLLLQELGVKPLLLSSPLMNTTYLLLGSNEGNREQWFLKAKELLEKNCGNIIDSSSLYETAAWGMEDQADFLNQVVCLTTELSAQALLDCILQIEKLYGRQREIKWGPRTLDIDILLFNDEVITTPDLTIPHPFLPKRRFTLAPLCEIAPNLLHPQLHKTMQQLLDECNDPLQVKKLKIN